MSSISNICHYPRIAHIKAPQIERRSRSSGQNLVEVLCTAADQDKGPRADDDAVFDLTGMRIRVEMLCFLSDMAPSSEYG